MTKEDYGRSPAMEALPLLRKWNNLPTQERAKAAAEYFRWLIEQEQKDDQ